MPSSRPMAAAVTAWSPVIMRTRMPALWQRAMAALASGRGGSTMPTIASRVRSCTRPIRSPLGSKVGGVEVAPGDDHDPLAGRGDAVVLVQGELAVLVGDRLALAVRQPVRAAAGDEHVRRALDEAAHHRLALLVGHVVEGGHELVVGVEGHLGHPRVARPGAVDVDPALRGQHDQRALGRVADQGSRRPAGRRRTGPSAAGRRRGRSWPRRRAAAGPAVL